MKTANKDGQQAYELSFTGDLRSQIMIVIVGIGSFATFLPLFLNNISHYLGAGIRWGFIIFVVLYFMAAPLALLVRCVIINSDPELAPMLVPVHKRFKWQDFGGIDLIVVAGTIVFPLVFFLAIYSDEVWSYETQFWICVIGIGIMLLLATISCIQSGSQFYKCNVSWRSNPFLVIHLEYFILILLALVVCIAFYQNVLSKSIDSKEHNKWTTCRQYDLNKKLTHKVIPSLQGYVTAAKRAELSRYNASISDRQLDDIQKWDSMRMVLAFEQDFLRQISYNKPDSTLIRLAAAVRQQKPRIDSQRRARLDNAYASAAAMNRTLTALLESPAFRPEFLNYESLRLYDGELNRLDTMGKSLDSLAYRPSNIRVSGAIAKATVYRGEQLALELGQDTRSKWNRLLQELQYKGLFWLFTILCYCFTVLYLTRLELLRCDILRGDPEALKDLPYNDRSNLKQACKIAMQQGVSGKLRASLHEKGKLFRNFCIVFILLIIPFFKEFKKENTDLNKPFLQFDILPEIFQYEPYNASLFTRTRIDDSEGQGETERTQTVKDSSVTVAVLIYELDRIAERLDTLVKVTAECCAESNPVPDSLLHVLNQISIQFRNADDSGAMRFRQIIILLDSIEKKSGRIPVDRNYTGQLADIIRQLQLIEQNTRKTIPDIGDRLNRDRRSRTDSALRTTIP